MPHAVLEVLRGQMKGRRFPLKEGASLVIGRSHDSDIQVPDREVSRFHCRLHNQSDGILLIDAGSFNGTRVNGELVKKRMLQDRDTIMVGTHEFRIDMLPDEGRPRDGVRNSYPRIRVERDAPPVHYAHKARYDGPAIRISTNMQAAVGPETWQWVDAFCLLASRTHSEKDPTAIYEAALDTMLVVPGVVRAAVVIQDPRTLELDTVAAKANPLPEEDPAAQDFVVSRSIVEDTLKTGVSTIVQDTRVDRRYREQASIVAGDIRGTMCVPLKTDDKVIGVLYVDSGSRAGAFREPSLRLLAAIGHQAGAALARVQLIQDLEALFLSTVRTMAAAIEVKDPYTRGHSERVTAFALMLADEVGVPRALREAVELSGLLHDVGKIGVPERVLLKPGRPSEDEWDLIKRHPEAGVAIVRNLEHCDRMVRIPDLVDAIRHHHERFDGTGYPAGLKGKEIPWAARILAVADTFDAITSDRVYRKGRDAAAAMRILEANAGSQFDPDLVAAFRRVYERGETQHPEGVLGRFHKTRDKDTVVGL